MNRLMKAVVFCLVAAALVTFAMMRRNNAPTAPSLSYSQMLDEVRAGRVAAAVIEGGASGLPMATARNKDGGTFRTVLPPELGPVLDAMQQSAVDVRLHNADSRQWRAIWNAIPFLLLLVFWFLMMMRFRGPANLLGR